MDVSTEELKELLGKPRKIAVYGASTKSEKAGNYVPKFLAERGHQIIPINPYSEQILGIPTLKGLQELTSPVDVLIIYRNSSAAREVIEEAVNLGVEWIWLPEGVESKTGRTISEQAGKMYVEDKCPKALIEKWEKQDGFKVKPSNNHL